MNGTVLTTESVIAIMEALAERLKIGRATVTDAMISRSKDTVMHSHYCFSIEGMMEHVEKEDYDEVYGIGHNERITR